MFNEGRSLKVGDQVQIIGIVGPVMIIDDIESLSFGEAIIYTVWFSGDELQKGTFNAKIIAKINE